MSAAQQRATRRADRAEPANEFLFRACRSEVNSDWTLAGQTDCGVLAGLYCFEQP